MKRLRRIAANFPRLNSLLVSTHDVAFLLSTLTQQQEEIERLAAQVKVERLVVADTERARDAYRKRLARIEGLAKATLEPAAALIEDDHINLGLNDGWALKLAVDALRSALSAPDSPEEDRVMFRRAFDTHTNHRIASLLRTLVSGHDGHPSETPCQTCDAARREAKVLLDRAPDSPEEVERG